MKAKLIFNLENTDDLGEFQRCVKANDMASVIWEFLKNSRKEIEWEFENNSTKEGVDVFDGIDRCFDHFHKLIEENSIDIDRLYS